VRAEWLINSRFDHRDTLRRDIVIGHCSSSALTGHNDQMHGLQSAALRFAQPTDELRRQPGLGRERMMDQTDHAQTILVSVRHLRHRAQRQPIDQDETACGQCRELSLRVFECLRGRRGKTAIERNDLRAPAQLS